MKLTIEQLADKVNEVIAEQLKVGHESLKDGRQSNTLSTRRIRDYITKGLIEKPVGDGREKWFDESHVNALVALRLLQRSGLSDKYVLSSSNSDPLIEQYAASVFNNSVTEVKNLSNDITAEDNADKVMQNNAQEFLRGLQGSPISKSATFGGIASAKGASILESAYESSFNNKFSNGYVAKESDSQLLNSLVQPKFKQFNEYCVEEKLGVFLKVDSKTDVALQRKLVEAIKNEINNHNKENKND